MTIMSLKNFFEIMIEVFNVVGVFIIILGITYSMIHYLIGFRIKKSKTHAMDLTQLRSEICNSIVLGLDFMVAATVIESVISPGYSLVEPDYYRLGLVALMIFVRIAFSYYLAKELEVLGIDVKK